MMAAVEIRSSGNLALQYLESWYLTTYLYLLQRILNLRHRSKNDQTANRKQQRIIHY